MKGPQVWLLWEPSTRGIAAAWAALVLTQFTVEWKIWLWWVQVCGTTKGPLYLHSYSTGVSIHPWLPGEEVPHSWAHRTWRRHCFISAGNCCCTFLQHQKLTLGVRSEDEEAVARSLELETPVTAWTLNALPFWENPIPLEVSPCAKMPLIVILSKCFLCWVSVPHFGRECRHQYSLLVVSWPWLNRERK